MSKQILFNEQARRALKRGVDTVADAVKITIGPRGRNVVLDKSYGAPTITNDGVSIAKEITLKDRFENMGAEIVKEVAQKTNDVAGDGTTTSVILTQAIVGEGMKHAAMGVNVMLLRSGIEKAAAEVVAALKAMAKPIKSKDEVRQVAAISSESEELGAIIAETIDTVGKDGVVTVEESQSFGVEKEIVEGLSFDKGYISPYMITSAERMEAEYRDPLILVTDKKISAIKDILPLLEQIAASGKKDLVIIADDVDGEALTTFVLNKLRGTFNILAVKAPGYGDRKKEMLADIAVVCGAELISEELGQKLETAPLHALGRAGRIIATKDNTTIVGGRGKKQDIDARVLQLKKQLETTESKYDKEQLQERIAKLAGGVAVIKVGAATETEMKYLKLKIEDAVNATKAAIEEGVVAGGGSAFIKAAKKVASARGGSDLKYFKSSGGKKTVVDEVDIEINLGYQIVLKALEAPLRQIAINAGLEDGAVVVEKVREAGENAGYDALEGVYRDDMLKAGIIDPVKVARSAVENAASAAAILLTTEAAIAEEPEEKKNQMPGNPGMDMDY